MAAIINLDKVKKPDVITIVNGLDALENGAFFAVGGLQNALLGRDVFKVEKLTEGCQLAYLSDGSVPYDESKDERDFVLAAGKISRGYLPEKGRDCITISEAHVGEVVIVGDILEVKPTSYQLRKKTTGAGVAVVLEKYTFEGQPSLYIKFL